MEVEHYDNESSDSEIESESSISYQKQSQPQMEDHKSDDDSQSNVKPHLRNREDYSHLVVQQMEDTKEESPLVVVVQGPSKSGKTTLIRSLIKHYTKHSLKKVVGPITLRSSKKQRITIIECQNDINQMIDLSKIADLALLVIDSSIGFEMSTFEFLSILKSHGFPNVMGVLTHMDFYKQSSSSRKVKKGLKKRFEYEVGKDNKLFYLSGLKQTLNQNQNHIYGDNEINNLARFINVMKYKQIDWKMNHPFILVDRFESNQEGEQQEDDDQTVSFYGYVRGASYRTNNQVHILGLGDYPVSDIQIIDDPCPIMNNVLDQTKQQDEQQDDQTKEQQQKQQKKKLRNLKQNERTIYAPYSNLGFLNFEKSGGYISIPDDYVVFTKKDRPDVIMENEQEDGSDQESEESEEVEEGVQIVRHLQDLDKNMDVRIDQDQETIDLVEGIRLDLNTNINNQSDHKDQDYQDRREMNLLKNKNMKQFSSFQFDKDDCFQVDNEMYTKDITKLIYQDQLIQQEVFDSNKFETKNLIDIQKYNSFIKSLFVVGNLDNQSEDEDDIERFADKPENDNNRKDHKTTQKQKEQEILEQDQLEKKKMLEVLENKEKVNFELEQYLESDLGIFKKGKYIKITIEKIKYKNYRQFSGNTPLVMSHIGPGEDNFGFLKVRIKKHRWYPNILKNNDPLIFSIGWRRFQTMPIFAKQDENDRYRMIKYTPQHDFCYAFLYGSFVPQNTGVVCTQTLNNKLTKFRISATGVVMELNHNYDIKKKLKLTGEPYKIYKNTALIKNMFNSQLEVSKFIGAQIKTVSGLRGQIKKVAQEGPQGTFRATFEDKIKLSDIVFCRTWYRIQPEKFYNPICSFEKETRLMKTTYELRKKYQIKNQENSNSQYREIERKPAVFRPLQVPQKLQQSLPFKTKEKLRSKSLKAQIQDKESQIPVKSLLDDKQKQVYSLIQRLNTIRKEKEKVKKEKEVEKKRIKEARQQSEIQYRDQQKKKLRQKKFSKLTYQKNRNA